MPNYLKDFFSWSNKERIGVIALSTFLLVLFFLNFFFDRWFSPKMETWNADSLSYYSQILDSLEKEVSIEQSSSQQTSVVNKLTEKSEYYSFDPNKIGKDEWMFFGFSDKQAQSILNFKKSIKGFKTKEDLARCYVIDSIKMVQLNPYIQINTTIFEKEIPENLLSVIPDSINEMIIDNIEDPILVELNKADSIQLLSIRGIGPYYSNKIIKYRTQLGGYFKKDQLLEIWNFDSARYIMVYDQIYIDSNLIVKINVNLTTVDTLKIHPYIRWSLANAIVKYRSQHGKYKSVNDLKKVILMTDTLFNLLSPYLGVD